MWIVYDEYDEDFSTQEFHDVESAGDFVERADDPLSLRIRYAD